MPQRSMAAAIASRPGGEVQVDRHVLPASDSRDVRERAADRRRQQQADVRSRPAAWRRIQRDSSSAATSARPKVSGAVRRVGHRRTTPSDASPMRMNWRPSDFVAGRALHRRRSRAELHQREARLRRPVVVDGSGAPNATVTGYGNAHRPLPEERAALEAEDAAPDAIEVDRDDRHVEPVDDPLEAALERQQVAGAADRAFREDADDVAVLQLLPRAPRSRRPPRGRPPTGIACSILSSGLHRPVLVVRLVDQEADEALDARADQRAVDVRQVVADEQRRAARRHVLLAVDADPVDRVREQPEAEAHEELRHDAEHVDARRRASATPNDQDDPVGASPSDVACRARARPTRA